MSAILRSVLLTAVLVAIGCSQSGYPIFCAVSVDDSPTKGLDSAWATVVVFSDFQCPYCGNAASTLAELEGEYDESDLRIVFKHLPLSFHEHAMDAAIAAECAHEQGLFWEMHDLLFANQDELDADSLAGYAATAGLDVDLWETCRTSQAPRDRIAADRELATAARVPATPTFFINGEPLVGSQPLDDLVDAVDDALEKARDSESAAETYYETLTQLECE